MKPFKMHRKNKKEWITIINTGIFVNDNQPCPWVHYINHQTKTIASRTMEMFLEDGWKE